MKKILLIMLAVIIGMTAIAYTVQARQTKSEQVTPRGTRKLIIKVKSNEDGLPVIGVSVAVEGTSIGAITDIDGVVVLTIPTSSVKVQISFIGMKPITRVIPAGDGNYTLTLTMESDVQIL